MSFTLFPIGHVHGGRADAIDDDWGASRARIDLDPDRFTPDALAGLDDFPIAENPDRLAVFLEIGDHRDLGRQIEQPVRRALLQVAPMQVG